MSFLSRRTFLQTVAATVVSGLLPGRLRAEGKSRFWFLHIPSNEAWPVSDPVAWSLENARQPILERARARLLSLGAGDPQRIIRLVVRRCQLNLLEIQPLRVMVHFWGEQGQADLRPFFKLHGLARKGVRVTLIDRKKERAKLLHGDAFLFGQRLPPFWPWKAYWNKWQQRAVEEADDWTAASHTWSGFAWEGIEANRIPWAAMKSAWRRTMPMLCLNCDEPMILVNFGLTPSGMGSREARFLHAGRKCDRIFQDHSIDRFDVARWMASNLDAEVFPDFIMWLGKPTKHDRNMVSEERCWLF